MAVNTPHTLSVTNVWGGPGGKEIIRGVSFIIPNRRVVVLMGPNGSGKSTLANCIAGHPDCQITKGKISFNKKNILKLSPWDRARLGIFLAFQHPVEIPGVVLYDFLMTAYNATAGKKGRQSEFSQRIDEALKTLNLSRNFLDRELNAGLSGGEQKKAELLQLLVLQPRFIVLDEIDSGLDVDSLKVIGATVKKLQKQGSSFLVITHYQRLLNYLPVDTVLVLRSGKIVASGDRQLAKKIEKNGYQIL